MTAPLHGEWSEAWGRQAAGILLAQGAEVDAVIGGNDQIARGVGDALREAGRPVPAEVALTGFDNWDVMALASRPALTSVEMDLEGLGPGGRRAVAAGHRRRPAAGRAHPPGAAGRPGLHRARLTSRRARSVAQPALGS